MAPCSVHRQNRPELALFPGELGRDGGSPDARLRLDERVEEDRVRVVGDLVERVFPEHSNRVTRAFGALDESEKRSLAELCRKLAA